MKKKKSVFRIFFLSYLVLLAVCCVAAVVYVRDCLILYENAQPEVCMEAFVTKLSEGGAMAADLEEAYLEAAAPGKFDDAESCREWFSSKMSGAVFCWKQNPQSYDTSMPVYDVYADEDILMKVTLRSVNPRTRLGIMTISDWELEKMDFCAESFGGELPGVGTGFSYDISVPDTCRVTVNQIELGKDELMGEPLPMEEFRYVAEYVKMPELVTYRVEGLAFEPDIVIRDLEGETVAYEEKNGSITAVSAAGSRVSGEEYGDQVDVLHIAEQWSRFLTDDLTGAKHGVGQILPYLVPDSYLYEMAADYAKGVDITFVSGHVLNDFKEERVSDYIKYGENCFSCEVYFEKNMTLLKGGRRTDVFYNRMFFVYLEDPAVVEKPGWYLADMQAVIGDGE